MGATSTINECYEFQSENLAAHGKIIEPAGIRGSRSRQVERLRAGTITCSGDIHLNPGPTEIDNLLPRITGGTKQGDNSFPLSDTLPYFWVSVDRVTKVFTYNSCKVAKAVFRASEGDALECALSVEALTETVASGGSFPALFAGTAAPYVFMDGALVVAGNTQQVKSVEIVYDNHLNTGRFMNSVTRTDLPEIDREVFLNLVVPYTSDTSALYNPGVAGQSGTFTFTNGSNILTFTFVSLVPPPESPVVTSKDEEFLHLSYWARKSGVNPGTPEVVITNTP